MHNYTHFKKVLSHICYQPSKDANDLDKEKQKLWEGSVNTDLGGKLL